MWRSLRLAQTAIWVGLIELTNSVVYYRLRMKSSNFYRFVLLNVLVIFHFICFFSPQQIPGFCCTVNAFTLLKYFQPSTGSTIRQQVFKTFRLELARADWELQFQALSPAPLFMMQHKFTSAQRRKECGTTDGIAPDLGHFPIKGVGGVGKRFA